MFRSSSAKEKFREESLTHLTKDHILQMIDEGFETAKTPVTIRSMTFLESMIDSFQLEKHYTKPSVVKMEEWPLFPDFDV